MENIMFNKKPSAKKIAFTAAKYFFLVLFLLFFLFPFFVMLGRSFMTRFEVIRELPERLWPEKIVFDGYKTLLADRAFPFGTYLKNTLIIVVLNMLGQAISAAICAFGFSKIKFPGRDTVFGIVLATMMLPGIAMQIPLYMIYYKLKWTNTLLPLVVPAWFGGGVVNIFLIKQYMRGIQNDMMEAARIDGANIVLIFVRIILPLCKPVVLLVMVNAFFGCWNDYSGALIFLTNKDSYTLSLGLYFRFRGGLSGGVFINEMMAAGVIMSLPCAVVFFIFQRQLIDGVSMGSVKG